MYMQEKRQTVDFWTESCRLFYPWKLTAKKLMGVLLFRLTRVMIRLTGVMFRLLNQISDFHSNYPNNENNSHNVYFRSLYSAFYP